MQGSFSILSMLYRSCSIKTDFPVPKSPARIVRLFRGIPFGRTLSTASIPVSNDFGSKGTPFRFHRLCRRDKGYCNCLDLKLWATIVLLREQCESRFRDWRLAVYFRTCKKGGEIVDCGFSVFGQLWF